MTWIRNRVSSCLSNLSVQNLAEMDAECSPDNIGLPGGPRPTSQNGGVRDNIERTENSLSLWVNEAKDLPPKRRYYCEVHLDGTLFARTSSRAVGKPTNRSSMAGDNASGSSGGLGTGGGVAGGCQLFWGEFFELDNLPSFSQITLHLFREEDSKKKRHSRDESSLHPLGSVTIPLADIQGRTYQEKWYPITSFKASASAGNKEVLCPQASLRIRARFQNLKVLPMEKYKEFAEYVTVNYLEMCGNLEPLLNVKEKEELAGALVHVLQSIGKAKVEKMCAHMNTT
ncbi:hypothetical protein GOODEAATRI_010836 [Goodea atripinnis]|uniref:C2 domain-containing protein n=1 Tax=Goodea atripinnis TaxID=208336 RepID=A0ABV0N9K8_9TELE